MGTQNQVVEPSPPRLRGRVARSRSIGTKLTPEEEKRILAAAEAEGKAPSEWARDLLLGGAASATRGETRTPDQVANLFRQVQANKAAKAQELLAKRGQKKETQIG